MKFGVKALLPMAFMAFMAFAAFAQLASCVGPAMAPPRASPAPTLASSPQAPPPAAAAPSGSLASTQPLPSAAPLPSSCASPDISSCRRVSGADVPARLARAECLSAAGACIEAQAEAKGAGADAQALKDDELEGQASGVLNEVSLACPAITFSTNCFPGQATLDGDPVEVGCVHDPDSVPVQVTRVDIGEHEIGVEDSPGQRSSRTRICVKPRDSLTLWIDRRTLAVHPEKTPRVKLSIPGPLALPCANSAACGTHLCNPTYGKCTFPCQGSADCVKGTQCMIGLCVPKPPASSP
jgi:hypothetical protein